MDGCYVIKTVRLTAGEWETIERARRALGRGARKRERSMLMSEAVLDAGHRLGVYVGSPKPPASREPWPHEPQRTETTHTRISVSLSRTVAAILSAAAKQVGTSEPRFLVGATLAYIARLENMQVAANASENAQPPPGCAELASAWGTR